MPSDASQNLDDSPFQDFVTALCKLTSKVVGMQSDGSTLMEWDDSLSPVRFLLAAHAVSK